MSPTPLPSSTYTRTKPVVLAEVNTAQFVFYFQGQLRTGMRYRQELYSLVGRTGIELRHQAHRAAMEMGLKGIPVVMTISDRHCSLWVNLKLTPGLSL